MTTLITRRGLLGSGIAGAALLSAPSLRRAGAEENVLYVNTWGGGWEDAMRAAFFDAFTAKTGIEIRTVSPISFAKLATQKETGTYEFDVTSLGVADTGRANRAGLLVPLEGRIDPGLLWDGAFYENGLALYGFANQIAYHADRFSAGGPDTWAKFFDTAAYPGDRSLQRHAVRVLTFALLADGVPVDQLFPMDVERAFAKLEQIKPSVRVWWTAGPQARQILTDGEVAAAALWDSDASAARAASKDPVEIVWNEAVIDTACWVAAAGSPREANAVRLLEFMAGNVEGLAQFCVADQSGPMNPKAFDFIPQDVAQAMPTWPANREKAVFLDGAKIVDQIDDINTRFEDWIAL